MFDSSDSMSSTLLPPVIPFTAFTDARAAVERLVEIYFRNTAFIRDAFSEYAQGRLADSRARVHYPAVCIKVGTYQERAEERRGGQACVRTGTSRLSPYHYKNNIKEHNSRRYHT